MTTKFNADTSEGLKIISDNSGLIEFQSAGVTKAGVNATGLTGDASQVTALNAAAVTSGTLPMARLSGTLPALNGSALTSLPAQTDASKLPLAGGTLTGNITLEAVTETKTTKTGSFTPNLTDDGTLYSCSGTMTITMPSATAGKSFTIIHASANQITWSGTIKWNGGSAPTAATAIEIYVFVSDGTNWYANQAGTGYA
jgi:hypothetical protein|tara:strand:+ start:1497 stop:2093 length:597 start_codon:yes stop_codon:yes gene_type:complete